MEAVGSSKYHSSEAGALLIKVYLNVLLSVLELFSLFLQFCSQTWEGINIVVL